MGLEHGTSYPERVLAKILGENRLPMPRTTHRIVFGDSRRMHEVPDGSVHLVVTSPPYPMIKIWDDIFNSYGCKTYDQMHQYLAGVWKECYRVLVDGGIACINIGDATRDSEGTFKLFPNHAKVIEICQRIGFISLPYILWKKPTTKPNSFLGSGFIPTNAYVTLDCEYILIFRRGKPRKFRPKDLYRYASHYTREQRDKWFSQIWDVKGVRQENNEVKRRTAAYPEEVACRLIRMFSIIGDTVLDPFLGTGTTTKAAMQLYRNSVGYEIDENLLELIKKKVGYYQEQLPGPKDVEIVFREDRIKRLMRKG